MSILAKAFMYQQQQRPTLLTQPAFRSFALYRKPKTAHLSYTCVPAFMKPAPVDPFDYPLRPKQEILDEFKYHPAEFSVGVLYKKYAAGDTRSEDNLDNRDRIAKIWVNIKEMKLAPLQRERFIYLLGNRWVGSDKVKIVCR